MFFLFLVLLPIIRCLPFLDLPLFFDTFPETHVRVVPVHTGTF